MTHLKITRRWPTNDEGCTLCESRAAGELFEIEAGRDQVDIWFLLCTRHARQLAGTLYHYFATSLKVPA